MGFCNTNMQTGILVLLFVLVALSCFSLFFINREVRNLKLNSVKNKNDLQALQSLLGEHFPPHRENEDFENDQEDDELEDVSESLLNSSVAQPSNENESVENVIPRADVETIKETAKETNVEEESSEEESSEEDE